LRDIGSLTKVVGVCAARTFRTLLAEGASAPIAGWDFSWLDGRASEERPSWGYSRMLAARMAEAETALDLQTGGGEVLAEVPHLPRVLMATESWPVNVDIAARNLHPRGALVVRVPDDAALPFTDGAFDLVVSRHPTRTQWPEIARVLRPGGRFLSQQVGAGSSHELTEFLMGPRPVSTARSPDTVAAAAKAAGLTVVDLRQEKLRMEFHDVGAVVYFLRKVIWTVPDFTVDRYRDRLAALHDRIEADGCFVSHSHRFLIEARRA
jgi:SAM-dependent methyltransferase